MISYRNDFDVETISSVAAGLQPSNDDIPDVKKVINILNYKIFFEVQFFVFFCSVPIAIEMHLLSAHCVDAHHIALHFVKVKTGTIIKWSVTIHRGALCSLFKLKNETCFRFFKLLLICFYNS